MSRGTVTGIQDWPDAVGLEKYGAVSAKHHITLEVLPDLTAPDSDRLALETGPQRRRMLPIPALSCAVHGS
jgi:hypothetical protein